MGIAEDFLNDGDDTAERFLSDVTAEKSGAIRRHVADPAISLLKGAIGVPEAAIGLADLVTGGRAGKLAQDVGFDTKKAKGVLDEFLTPEQHTANRKVEQAEGFIPTIQAALENPSTIGSAILESAPSMIGGGVLARGLMKVAPKVGPVVAGAVGEGAVGAGMSAEQIRQATEDGLLTPEQAALAGASGLFTGALGAAGGKVAQKLGITDVDTLMASGKLGAGADKSILKKIPQGMLAEGVLEELPQSAQEQVMQNLALGKPWDEGVPEAAAMGMLAGGVMGGGFAAVNRRREDPAPVPEKDPVSGLLPNLGNEPLMVFPDGSTGTKAQFDAYIAGLPENERAAARAKMMGMGSQDVQPEAEPDTVFGGALPSRDLDPLIAFPDGSVGKRSQVDAYIASLPEKDQPAARAKFMGLGSQAVQPEPQPESVFGGALSSRDLDPLIVFPDGSVGRRADVNAYVARLPEKDRPSMRAKLLGLGQQDAVADALDQAAQGNSKTAAEDLIKKAVTDVISGTNTLAPIKDVAKESAKKDMDSALEDLAKLLKPEPKPAIKAEPKTQAKQTLSDADEHMALGRIINGQPLLSPFKESLLERGFVKEADGNLTVLPAGRRRHTELSKEQVNGNDQKPVSETVETKQEAEKEVKETKGIQTTTGNVSGKGVPGLAPVMATITKQKQHAGPGWADIDIDEQVKRARDIMRGDREASDADSKYFESQAKRLEKKGVAERSDKYQVTAKFFRDIAEAIKSHGKPAEAKEPEAANPVAEEKQEVEKEPKLKPLSNKQIDHRNSLRQKARDRRVITSDDTLIQAIIKAGGIHDSMRGDITGESKGNVRLPFVGSLFTKNGTQDLSDLANRMTRHAFFTEEEADSVDGGRDLLIERVRAEYNGAEVSRPMNADDSFEAEYKRLFESEYDDVEEQARAEAESRGIEFDGIANPEDLELAGEKVTPENLVNTELLAKAIAIDSFFVRELAADMDPNGEMTPEFIAALEQFIKDNDNEIIQSNDDSDQSFEEDEVSTEGASEEDIFGLESQTEEDLKATQAEQEKADKEAKKKSDAEEKARREAAEKKEIDQRGKTAANDFVLGGNAMDELAGQKDIFSQPESKFKSDSGNDGINAAEAELRKLSHDKEAAGDVRLGNGKYVSFDDAVRLAREGIDSGVIKPVPFQLVNRLDLAFRDVDRVITEATKPAAKTPAPKDAAKEKAKQDLNDALGDLADIFGKNTKANLTPEQEKNLMPVLSRVMDAALRMGYYKFKDAAKFVLDTIKEKLGIDISNQLTLDHLQGSYIAMAGKYREQGAEGIMQVGKVVSLEEITQGAEDARRDDNQPDSENGKDGDGMGKNPVPDEPGGNEQAGPGTVPGANQDGDTKAGSEGVSTGSTASSGKGSDNTVHSKDGQFGPENGATGNSNSSGSDLFGDKGIPDDARESGAVKEASNESRKSIAEKVEQQKKAESVKVVHGDRANIDATLPFLSEGQREDVHFAEKRLGKDDGYGVLFTNGTGTGKTYLGLGIIKRMVKQGKKNGIIVVPNDKMIEDWIESGKNLGLDINMLENTTDKGRGIAVTTYANFGANLALASRDYDFIVSDESQNLMQNAQAENTASLETLRAITLHPRGAYRRAQMLYPELWKRAAELEENHKTAKGAELAALEPQIVANSQQMQKRITEVRENVESRQGAARPRVVMLSATPFAYEPNIQLAEGYLFEFDNSEPSGAYNAPNGYQKFMIQHFGYRMRTGKLNQPDAKVDSSLMQRQFNTWMRNQGALSARVLDVEFDYDRKFVMIESSVGSKLDEGLDWLSEEAGGRYQPLYDLAKERFDYLSRMRLLEAIKAEAAIPYIKEYHKLGRQVIVFHDYNEGGGFSPFKFTTRADNLEQSVRIYKEDGSHSNEMVKWNDIVNDFNRIRPDLANLDFGRLPSPIATLTKAFPNAMLFNGNVSKDKRRQAIAQFNNDDNKSANLLIVQSAANAGWSGHDTTGKHPRVIINLGIPAAPTKAIQQEGRAYRTGQASDAIFRYMNTGTNWERWAFASTIARRASTAENLAMGEQARGLLQSFIDAFENSGDFKPSLDDGKGGKALDRQYAQILSEFDRARSFYYGRQKKTSRDKSKEGTDYFATPEPVGFKMVEWLDIQGGDRLLEPSAGHGAIGRWFPHQHERTLIEPSNYLASSLGLVSDAKVVQDRFESHNIVNKYDGIAMNPPFGVGGKTAIEHLDKAFKHLHDGGRIVALIPTGPAADKRFDKWMYDTDSETGKSKNPHAHLRANILLPAETFQRAGTSVLTRIVIIDKLTDPKLAQLADRRNDVDLSGVSEIDELFDRIKDMTVLERIPLPKPDATPFEKKQTKTKQADEWAYRAEETAKESGVIADSNDNATFTTEGDKLITNAPMETVTTKSGKELKGVFVPASVMTRVQVKAIDEFTYEPKGRGNGYFVRLRHVVRPVKTSRKQTQTKAFKDWFGDSKVVDKNGDPLVVYHGTDQNITEFNTDGVNGVDRKRLGAYFTTNQKFAETYGATVNQVYLALKNPLDITGMDARGVIAMLPVSDRLKQELRSAFKGTDYSQYGLLETAQREGLQAELKKAGFDGIKYTEGYADAYVAFEPTQIKSATGNNGEFDPANPDIRASRTEKSAGGMSVADVEKAVAQLQGAGLKKIKIAATAKDLPEAAAKKYSEVGGGVRGFYIPATDEVWLVADQLNDAGEAVFTALHEATHRGLSKVFGEEINLVLRQIWATNQNVKRATAAMMKEFPDMGREEAIEEVLADMARDAVAKNLNGWQKLVSFIKKWLADIGFVDMKFTDEMVEELVAGAARAGLDDGNVSGQTDGAAFKKWFGDSKVVDSNGDPKVVYHGTHADITEFKKTKGAHLGFHFGDKDAANTRLEDTADSRIDQAEVKRLNERSEEFFSRLSKFENSLRAKNGEVPPDIIIEGLEAGKDINEILEPYDYKPTSEERATLEKLRKEYKDSQLPIMKMGADSNIGAYYLNVKKPLRMRDVGNWGSVKAIKEALPWDSEARSAGQLIDEIKARGYDGIVYENRVETPVMRTDSYIVFEPTQIKSAIGNNGEFDGTNPDVRTSRKPTASKYHEQNRRFREEHITLWTKAKKWLKRQLSPGGLLPEQVFDEKIKRDSEFEVVEFDIKHLVGQLERAIKKDYKLEASELDEKVQRLMSEVMSGNVSGDVPQSTKIALIGMRQYIDSLSKQYLKALEGQANDLMARAEATGDNRLIGEAKERMALYEVIMGNVGQYVHRSYKAFDDPEWARNVSDEVIDAARKYLINRNMETMDKAAAERRAEVVLNEMLKHGTAYDGMEAFIRESKLGAKDLSVLKVRKQIAPEIRALLGEYTDPRINFAKSATKMGRLIWNEKFLEKVREVGMGKFLFTDETKPPEATAKIAADSSEVFAPLNGLWTFPETDQAFKDALGKEKMEDWYRAVVKVNGMVKYGKTVLSPTTAARNWMSAFFFSVANGHFDMRHMAKSVDGLKEYFTHGGDAKKMAYLRKLKHLGVVYDTPYAGEMMRLLSDSGLSEKLVLSKGKLKIKNALEMATKFYQYGDDFWKIIGFENEKRMWMDTGMSEADAEVKAAKRIRDTYPTYSMVGKGIQSLRRFPLAGTFVSFPAEIIRTSYNMVKYLAEDYKNPKTRTMAMRRGLGLAITSSFAYAAQALSMAAAGFDDDDEEAVRLMAAPWQRNANLFFTGYDEQGNIRYMDMSFLDPYNYWKRPIVAVTRGQPVDKAITDVFKETLTPFFGVDIAAGTIFEIMANKKETGAPVYRERDDIINQVADITNHLRKTVQPGILSNMERTYKAIDGDVTPSGKRYDINDEARAWFGFRMATLDPKVALYYRSFDFKDSKAEAGKHVMDVIRNPKDVDSGDLRDALNTTNRLRSTAYKEMHLLIDASIRSGMTRQEIAATLKNSGVSKDDIMALLSGRVMPWRADVSSAKQQAKKAGNTFGAAGYKKTMERYKSLSSYRAEE